MNGFVLCAALLVLFYFALSYNVSRHRIRSRIGVGTDADADSALNRAIRAHGNAAEYLPLFVAILLYFGVAGAAGWVLAVAVIVTVSRVLHVVGMLTSRTLNARNPWRMVGALGTYLGGLALGVALLLQAL